jgi:hypothetical protein
MGGPNGATVVRQSRSVYGQRRRVRTAHRNASFPQAESNDRTRLEPDAAAWGGVIYRTPRNPFTLGELPADTFQSKIVAV